MNILMGGKAVWRILKPRFSFKSMKAKLIPLGIFIMAQTSALAHSEQRSVVTASDQKIILEVLLPISIQKAWKHQIQNL